MIVGLQILAILFSLAMIYFSVLHFKRKQIEKVELYSWIAIWTLTVFVVIFPDILRDIAQKFFITRLFDLMVVGGFILVITMVTKSYVTTKRIEKKMHELVRKEAIKKAEKKK